MDKTETNEHNVAEAKKLLEFLVQPDFLDSYNLTPREMSVAKMKWTYKLTDEQIAEKSGIKTSSLKGINIMLMTKLFHHIRTLDNQVNKTSILKKEVEDLRKENELLNKKFEALSLEEKENFKSMDIVAKNVSEVKFSEKTQSALWNSNIHTVMGLLQYRLSSLLMMKGFDIAIVEEIEKFAEKNRLKMKR